MLIPDGPNGHPTVSVSSLRKYGSGLLTLDEHEQDSGCPRLWKAHYIDRDPAVRDVTSRPLEYGTYWHETMAMLDTEDVTPDEAMRATFKPHYPPDFIAEIKLDLDNYFARSAVPSDRFGLLAAESELDALLYNDEQFGPIYLRGFIDWIGVDLDTPGVVHLLDYKTNRQPPRDEQVRGDVQLKAYHWLVQQNAHRFGNPSRIVSHLDAIKWRDVQVAFTNRDIEDWLDWAIAVTRAILRDDDAAPRVNSGCGWCPIRDTCTEFQALPETAAVTLDSMPGDDATDAARLDWRDAANKQRLLLQKAVEATDKAFQSRALKQGGLIVGDQRFTVDENYRNTVDVRALHGLVGDDVYELATVTKTGLERYAAGLPASDAADVLATMSREPVGMRVTRHKLEED